MPVGSDKINAVKNESWAGDRFFVLNMNKL